MDQETASSEAHRSLFLPQPTSRSRGILRDSSPPSDPSLNPHFLLPVFTAVTGNWWKFGVYRTVPEPRAALFREKFTDHDKARAEAGKYYALYHHNPSCKDLSVALYRAGGKKAAEICKTHLNIVTYCR